ncbi:hypothetical protein CHS0354_042639 [Potamilus streckersoni]|uniref:Mab-21-like HhH/H2TH-like domain-containing protein n=1 Tax=Potamilus streckersoni TaxID=2493646 RepID=A0AAE0WAZ5_9BIVA|nr:hypothetical protein CHS0354_042639 [Potamilus streckersoni]
MSERYYCEGNSVKNMKMDHDSSYIYRRVSISANGNTPNAETERDLSDWQTGGQADSNVELRIEKNIENVIILYLHALDKRQNEVYNVRMMHHAVWRDVHQVPGISEERAGSRVEKYTKILPIGAKSDVDYKLEVKNIEVETTGTGPIYLEFCDNKAYAKVYLSNDGIKTINESTLLSRMFKDTVTSCLKSDRLLVIPSMFKTNVVEHCQFEMQKSTEQTSQGSPAVSGEGALNQCDLVPCLKLKSWPEFVRKKVEEIYNFTTSDGAKTSMFVVPTGDAVSTNRDYEWRLSFALLEIAIFRQMSDPQRRLYGLLKYVFKVIFEKIDLISTYHLKVLFLRRLEEDDLANATPISFVLDFLKHIVSLVEKQYIPHYFIDGCNIFPFHKCTREKIEKYKSKVNGGLLDMVRSEIKTIVAHDLSIPHNNWETWLTLAEKKLLNIKGEDFSEDWIAGYLTRLLSVIVYCLQKSHRQNQLDVAIANLFRLVTLNRSDKHVQRIVPLIQIVLEDMYKKQLTLSGSARIYVDARDKGSYFAHKAFHCYVQGNFNQAKAFLDHAKKTTCHGRTLGVTVTKFHKGVDAPLDFVIDFCDKELNSNRFYLFIDVMLLHLEIQDLMRNKQNHDVSVLLEKLVHAASNASIREPYTGKLSYRQSSLLLVKGYINNLAISSINLPSTTQLFTEFDEILFDRKGISNFDLR